MPHAKMLTPAAGPGSIAVPMLVSTTSQPQVLSQLLAYGFSDPATAQTMTRATNTTLSIDHTRLVLVVDDQAILDDEDGRAPNGWWDAVDAIGGMCDVWIITQPIDLASPTIGHQLRTVLDTPGASVSSLVPIRHTAPEEIHPEEFGQGREGSPPPRSTLYGRSQRGSGPPDRGHPSCGRRQG